MRKLENLENLECCHRCPHRGRMLDATLEGPGPPQFSSGLPDVEATRVRRRRCPARLMCLLAGFALGLLVTTSCFLTLAVQSCVHHLAVGCRADLPNALGPGPGPGDPPRPANASAGPGPAFWPASVEALRPAGFGGAEHRAWRQRVAGNRVARVQRGCGRMHNRMVVFEDGAAACLRYRVNTDQIQGEIFTYHLARMLGINNIPPSVLVRLDSRSPVWSAVRNDFAAAEWEEGRLAVLAQWVPGLQAAFIPPPFRRAEVDPTRPPAVDSALLANGSALPSSPAALRELLQWTDLLALDYLTANLDRFVNSLINRQWNDQIMAEPAHNLELAPDRGLLVFLDNESGLFHGYRLLRKYWDHYEAMLRLSCLFRRPLVDALRRLPKDHLELERRLSREVEAADPVAHLLPRLTKENAAILTQRVRRLLDHVDTCRRRV